MNRNRSILFSLICFAGFLRPAFAADIPWTVQELIHGGRIDAIAYAGHHVVICGTRSPNPGWIYYSTDDGVTWHKGQHLDSRQQLTGVTCIQCGKNGLCFAINESSELFRSPDYGKTWTRLRKVSTGNRYGSYALSYGLCITKQGTLLISDTDPGGGNIYRSIDKGVTFMKIGRVSPKPLYRFDQFRDGLVVNGWEGATYRSKDDGQTWDRWGRMDSSASYATEYILPGTIVQASEAGYVYSQDADSRREPVRLAKPGGAADDFVYLGYHTLIYTTYTGSRSVFISYDEGKTWTDDGVVPTGAEGDWLDHVIALELDDSVVAIGGTHKGFIMRAAYARASLYAKTLPSNKNTYDPAFVRDLDKGLVGCLHDPGELSEPEDIFITGHLAYVPCRGSNNVAVIDISNPRKPTLVSSFRDPELIDAMGVAKNGKYVYITSMTNHTCLVVDDTDPKKWKKLYSFTVDDAPNLRKVVYRDGYLYLTHDGTGKVYIADAHDPVHPQLISSVKVGDDGSFAVYPLGNYAYTGGCNPGQALHVIDITDKRNPRLVNSLLDPGRYGCTCDFVTLDGRLVDVAYSSNSLVSYDISDPARPLEKGFLQTAQLFGPGRLRLIGHKAYIINSINDCFAEVDLSDPDAPKLDYVVPSWRLQKVYGVDVKDGLLYLAGRDARDFLVVDPRKF